MVSYRIRTVSHISVWDLTKLLQKIVGLTYIYCNYWFYNENITGNI